jgi:outer membrane protein assembly factor BamD (BamD/ComL family)
MDREDSLRLSIVLIITGLVVLACGGKKIENKAKISDEKSIFEQAQNFEKSQDYDKACASYQSIVDNFPDSPNRYKALFMAGYIQLEYLKDAKKASSAFETLLKQYPNCDLADDAKIMQTAATTGRDIDSIFQDSLNNRK